VGALNSANALRWFTRLDDLIFDIDSTPRPSGSGVFDRDIRYSWAYMLKRPRASDPSVVEMTVVIFNKRTLGLGGSLSLPESLYQTAAGDTITFDIVKNTITLTTASALPAVRAGDWLLDASYIPNPAGTNGTVNGYFYRVVGLTELANNKMEYEVQPSL